MRHLLSASPYPILRVKRDGTLIYANEVCSPLLEAWGIDKGQKLPPEIHSFVRKTILGKVIQEKKIKNKNKEYLFKFKSTGDGHVHIYGFDLTLLKPEDEIPVTEKTKEKEPDRIVPISLDLQHLLNQAAEMIAFSLQTESCRILGTPEFSGGIHNEKYFQEIASNRQNLLSSNEFAGGISVFARKNGKTFAVITLQKIKPAEFALEDLCFLRYVLSLVIRIIQCQETEKKLRDKVNFFAYLLHSVPDLAYFRNISDNEEDGFIPETTEDFSKEGLAGNPLLEIEKLIPEKLLSPGERKKKQFSTIKEETEEAGFLETIQDMRGLKESEETLKMALEVQKVLWTVINNSPAVVFLWRNEENWPVDFVSENISQFGYKVEDFTSRKFLYGNIIHREDIDRVRTELDHCFEAGNGGFRTEYRIYTKDGKLRWVDERTFIQRDRTGKATYLQGVVIDITERKIAEEAYEKAERLRKKELNHRIKNNLQIVSSLLDLQAEKFSDRKVVEAFRESESRILSMSLIHQELYESGKLDSLNFSSYLRKLTSDILRSYGTEEYRIQLTLDVTRIFLGVDNAVVLGIIINELLTNTLKYAFPAGSCGEVHIALFREKDSKGKCGNEALGETVSAFTPSLNSFLQDSKTSETLTLVFADNGKGFPEEIDFKNSRSLGLQLVNALVEQIEGSIDLERSKGTKFTIKFKGEVQEDS